MPSYVIFKTSSGEIISDYVGDCPELNHAAGEDFIESDGIGSSEGKYVLDGERVVRPAQLTVVDKIVLTADGVDEVIFSSVPSGTFTATNTTTKETVSGAVSGTDTFSTTIPGTYTVKVEAWPYLDFEITVEAS